MSTLDRGKIRKNSCQTTKCLCLERGVETGGMGFQGLLILFCLSLAYLFYNVYILVLKLKNN